VSPVTWKVQMRGERSDPPEGIESANLFKWYWGTNSTWRGAWVDLGISGTEDWCRGYAEGAAANCAAADAYRAVSWGTPEVNVEGVADPRVEFK